MSSPGVISFAYADFEINSVKNKWTAKCLGLGLATSCLGLGLGLATACLGRGLGLAGQGLGLGLGLVKKCLGHITAIQYKRRLASI